MDIGGRGGVVVDHRKVESQRGPSVESREHWVANTADQLSLPTSTIFLDRTALPFRFYVRLMSLHR